MQARRSASSRVAALEQRDDEARGERVAGAGAVDRLDRRRLRACDLLPVLEQHRAFGAEREADEPGDGRRAPRSSSRFTIVTSAAGRAVPRGRGVEEEARRELGRARDRLGRDLLLAEHRIVAVEQRESSGRSSAFAPGATTIVVSPAASTVISATPVGASFASHRSSTPASRNPASALVRELVAPDAADHRDLGAEPRRGDRLIRSLAAGHAREARAASRSRPAAAAARPARRGRG